MTDVIRTPCRTSGGIIVDRDGAPIAEMMGSSVDAGAVTYAINLAFGRGSSAANRARPSTHTIDVALARIERTLRCIREGDTPTPTGLAAIREEIEGLGL